MQKISVLVYQQRSKLACVLSKKLSLASFVKNRQYCKMTSTDSAPLILRLVSNSCNIANTAGGIVRKVLRSGELDVVDKVRIVFSKMSIAMF